MQERKFRLGQVVFVKFLQERGTITLLTADFDSGRPTYRITFANTIWLGSLASKVVHCTEDELEVIE